MFKKVISVLIASVILGAAVWAFYFYWQNLRGVGPAILPPREDIAKILESQNFTDFPLKLPPGFSISIFAKNLGSPRVLARAPGGVLITSIPSEGRVVALPDKNADRVADGTLTVAEGLNRPHGLAFQCPFLEGDGDCELYIAESHRVSLFGYDHDLMRATFVKKVADLPDGGNHVTRTLMFHEDGRLLISVGSSCNVCNESDWRRAKILALDLRTGELKEFARGLRNAVFMTTSYVTGKIWATEMGRDLLGDDTPPDEINIVEEGKNYGWPVCYGKNIHDTDFDHNTYVRNPCMEPFETPSHIDIQAHSAPLGLAFYKNDLLVAYHGSWNRSVPTGYKIVKMKLGANGHYLGEEDFISGWLQGGHALGRPVDILADRGRIFISDDKAGVIYLVEEDKSNLIRVKNIKNGDIVKSPLVIEGEARGYWFFEASFPIRIYDANGKELGVAVAQANPPSGGDWMTTEFVPFQTELKFSAPSTETGVLILERDNPSGLPENADELRTLVRFR